MTIPYQHVVVPLDGSQLAEAALDHAMFVAGSAGAAVTLVSVVPTIEHVVGPVQSRVSIDEQWQVLRARASAYLATVSRRAGWGSTVVRAVVEMGNAAETILAIAARDHADLIVMSTHGLSGVRRWMIGSVAEKVVLAASTPVLLIRVSAPPTRRPPERDEIATL